MKKISNIFLTLTILFVVMTLQENHYINGLNQTNEEWIDTTTFREKSYLYLENDLLSDYNVIDFHKTYSVFDQKTTNNETYSDESYTTLVPKVTKDNSFTYTVTVDKDGLYEIGLDYLLNEEFTSSPLIQVEVNNEIQFNESESIRLDVSWDSIPRDEADLTDRYGNELLPYAESDIKWYHQSFKDDLNFLNHPYKFILKEGVNEITITPLTTDIFLGDLTLSNAEDLITYEEYKQDSAITADTIRIEAEDFTSKNNLEIKGTYYKYPSLKPYSYKTNVLNILDGNAMRLGSDAVTYKINVEQTGNYKLSFKYRQDTHVGVAVYRNVYIDQEIPFAELENVVFPSSENYTNYTLNNNGEDYLIYLEKGEHEITLEVTNDVYTPYIIRLQTMMDNINNIGLRVSTITGNQVNAYRTWDIEKYLPTISEDLKYYSDEALLIYNELNALNPTRDEAPELTTLKIVSEKLLALSQNPNDIPNKMEELSEGSGSAYQLIGTAINSLTNQNMDIDSLFIHTNDDLPKATSNFFVRIWDGIKSFIYSFFDDRYQTSRSEEDELEVWVGESSLYVNLMQQMADDQFTKDTGIKVNIRVLANNQKIILSNANNSSPDVVMGIDSWLLYDYALRGMSVDLSELEGFDELSGHYSPNIFTPLIFEDGVYGIPETQGTQILIYRTDIFEYLELEKPETWDDVIEILPILQSYQMNFYHPLGGVSSWKGYMMTAPFIYQYGGEIYSEDASVSILRDETTKQAIEVMTDLFTVYDMPKQTSSFFEHFRSGTMPIGVTDIGTYLQIKYAASELTGQYEISPIPGNDLDGDGVIERYQPAYGKAGMMIESSELQDEAWEFMKWWNDADTQAAYLQTIKSNLGERYMMIPANKDALSQSVWTEDIKETYLSQAEWIRTPAVTPGSYIVERELSNIWNKIVIDKDNPRIAIDESIIRVERELERKLTEFGYIDDSGNVDYTIPRYDNIENWIRGEEDDE